GSLSSQIKHSPGNPGRFSDGSLLVCIMDRELRIKDIPKPQNLIFRICRKGGVNKYPLMKTELVQM
ncbi:hypothetical protein, partial [Escherichia coli]|uniref:hypothetical protein n=1 Tax=Escherichia coli TaxID=562 RepID=UPI00201A35C4